MHMSMSCIEAMLLLRLKVGSIDVGCPMPRRFYELINTELGALAPILEDLPSLAITITASTILGEWTPLALLNLVSTGLTMTFKLIGIVIDNLAVNAEEDDRLRSARSGPHTPSMPNPMFDGDDEDDEEAGASAQAELAAALALNRSHKAQIEEQQAQLAEAQAEIVALKAKVE